jgi:putative beta-lysine N-acetyltransferase
MTERESTSAPPETRDPTKAPVAFVPDVRPTPSRPRASLGVVELVLDDTQTVKAVGVVYGLEHTIRGEGYEALLFLDQYNQRIKILEYRASDMQALILRVRALATANGLDKIIAMATHDDWQEFLRFGYVLEAVIRHYHRGEDAFVVSKFRSQERLTSTALMEETLLIEQIMTSRRPAPPAPLSDAYDIVFAERSDIPELVALYTDIFASYPSPLIHSSYLETVFGDDTIFAVCRYEGAIVAAASIELHPADLAAELTDCATLQAHRGRGLMTHLLRHLEGELERRSYVCAYTMARARSFGMNAVFFGMGYEFMGRLVNNCDIYGAFEDMNIWVRRLGPDGGLGAA